ncbi:MAG: aminoglycoside phosphotransferase family protein [Propionibacteriaceae bacterium]
MSETPDLGPVPQRVPVNAAQVRRLIEEQFPEWAGLPVEPVANGGWDNWTFHLGTDLVVRLPSAAEYARAVEKEHRWLPLLAPCLPLPVPVPLVQGRPSDNYPHTWSILRWIPGVTAANERIADPIRFAADLAEFLIALRRVEAIDGPQPGIHNWFRGGTLRTFDESTQDALETLHGRVNVGLARAAWADSLAAPWDGVDHWFHGDVAEGNLLLQEGHLAAVIDFGTCGVGDPACDLAVAWTLLSAEGRKVFRERLAIDDASWSRGRGWALWKALATCSYTGDETDPEDRAAFAQAELVLDGILTEYSGG